MGAMVYTHVWVGDRFVQKSTIVVMAGRRLELMCFASRFQKLVALSETEAELNAHVLALCRSLCSGLGWPPSARTGV